MSKASKTAAPSNRINVGGRVVEMPIKGYKLSKRITSNLFSLTYNTKLAFRVEGEMIKQDSAKKAEEDGKPMTVMPVINMETGESLTMIVPTVLESALNRVVGGYVGKQFFAVQGAKPKGKRYFDVELYELEKD